MPHVNKKTTSEKLKFNSKKIRSRMSCEWIGENHLENSLSKKPQKTVKIRVKLPHVNKKTTTETEFLFKHRFLTLL